MKIKDTGQYFDDGGGSEEYKEFKSYNSKATGK